LNIVVSCLVCVIVSCLVCTAVVVLCVLLSSYMLLLYYMGMVVFTLDAGLLARSQYSEGPTTGLKVLRPATSTRVLLSFLGTKSKC
jgi:hypothetical protein